MIPGSGSSEATGTGQKREFINSRRGYSYMLVLKVTMLEGRSQSQKEELIQLLSQTASRELKYPLEEIRVVLYEVSRSQWGVAGRSFADQDRRG
jgi:4-oxalocrotonate tautomerase